MNSSTKALPMTKDETMLLVQLIAANPVVNNKATNATNNKMKEEAWQSLSDEFNSSVSSFPRTPAQLRLKWENLKKSARKRSASIRSSQNKTGGGKDYFPPDEVLDKVASLLGSTCQGFSVEFGGDAITPNHMSVLEVVNEGEAIGLRGDGEGYGEGVCDVGAGEEQVLKIIDTPAPKHNFFLNRASGSGSLAKRKHRMEMDKCKARIERENALTDYLIAKRKKIELENDEKELTIARLKLDLEKAKLENEKLKSDLNLL